MNEDTLDELMVKAVMDAVRANDCQDDTWELESKAYLRGLFAGARTPLDSQKYLEHVLNCFRAAGMDHARDEAFAYLDKHRQYL